MDFGAAFDAVAGRGRRVLLAAVATTTVVAGWHAARVPIDHDNAALNADDGVTVAANAHLRRAFPHGEIVVLALSRPDLLDPDGLDALEELTRSVATIDGVRRVDALTRAVELVHGPFGAEPRPLVPRERRAPGTARAVEAAIDRNPHLVGLLVSPDRTTAGLIVELDPEASPDVRDRTIDRLSSLADRVAPGERRFLTGTAVVKREVARRVARDQRVLLPGSVAVLALALGVAFRRRSAVVLPLGVTGIAVVWTLGLYAWTGHAIHPVTSLLAPLLMTVSVSTAVHVHARWSLPGAGAGDARSRARAAVADLAVPCFLTALTTALGLLSLTLSDLPAVRQFGAFGALGVALAFVLDLTLLPVLLARLRPPRARPARRSRLEPWLARVAALSVGRPGLVVAIAAVATGIGVVGVTRIHENTDLLGFLDPDLAVVRDTRAIEARLGGTAVLEWMVEIPGGERFGDAPETIARLDAFERAVLRVPGVTGTFGLTDLVRAVRRAETGDPGAGLPVDRDALAAVFDVLEAADDADPVRDVLTPDRTATRLLVRLRSLGSAEADAAFDGPTPPPPTTLGPGTTSTPGGPFHALVVDSNRLVAGLSRSVILAVTTVLAALAAVFRSFRLLAAAVVPNAVPVVLTFGFMGFAGIDLSTGTAMIASVVLGIAVDGTIHWIARFREASAVEVGARAVEATRRAGRPLTIASAVLAVGFWVGALGSFQPTVYFSVLTGATILVALACDLVVLPACIVLLRPRSDARRRSSPS